MPPLTSETVLFPLRPELVLLGPTVTGETPANFVALFPRAMASLTVTVTGTVTTSDTLTVNVILPLLSGGQISETITVAGGDSTTTIAQKIAKAFSLNSTFQGYGAVAYSAANVVTIEWPGLLGNQVTCTTSKSGGATETLTVSNSGAFSGGSGPIVAVNSFELTYLNSYQSFEAGKAYNVSAGMVAAMVAANSPIW